ncbi:MAG: hypothetical protein ACYC27_03030 [Armatimonadota bacterium]
MDWTYPLMLASVIATIANIYKCRWCFIVWLITNLIWCIHNYRIHQNAQSIQYLVYAMLAVWGLWEWRKKSKSGGSRGKLGDQV